MRPTREEVHKRGDIYFVSTQTAGRKPFFRHQRWAQLMVATLGQYGETSFDLHAYIVMPDYLHLLLTSFETVEKAVQLIKGGFSYRARRELEWRGEIWQQGFADQRIRGREDWERHLQYIRMNPVKARLAEESESYPFMAFLNVQFPQGLKPHAMVDPNVRAEARTLHENRVPNVRAEARTFRDTRAETCTLRAQGSTLRTQMPREE
jgi:putative transposase